MTIEFNFEPREILAGEYTTEQLKSLLGVEDSWELDIIDEHDGLRPLKPGEIVKVVCGLKLVSHVRQGARREPARRVRKAEGGVPERASARDGDRINVFLPKLPIRSNGKLIHRDALLCPHEHGGYDTRLFLSEPVEARVRTGRPTPSSPATGTLGRGAMYPRPRPGARSWPITWRRWHENTPENDLGSGRRDPRRS